MTEMHLRESPSNLDYPRIKPAPKNSKVPVPFSYWPSDDGTDENILILLHGLGDTHTPFAKLGRQLKLPQTAVLAIRAPEQWGNRVRHKHNALMVKVCLRVPFLYEKCYQWYPSFDDLGEMIERPNPTPALDVLSKVLDHLMRDCNWPAHRIHLFGFAQGGSVAAEFGIKWWKEQLQQQKPASHLGSITSVSGPLLSYPTVSSLSLTPVLVVHRPSSPEFALSPGSITSYRKAFQSVTEVKLSSGGQGMPASKPDWEPIMRFWSEKLGRRQVQGMYEVMSGISTS